MKARIVIALLAVSLAGIGGTGLLSKQPRRPPRRRRPVARQAT
jgi:hypothetical protein